MYLRVFVEASNHIFEVLLGDVFGKVFVDGGNSDFFAVADFGTDVAVGSGVVSNENCPEPGSNREPLYLLSYLLFDCVGEGLTVEKYCCHRMQARSDLVPKVAFVGEDH